MLFKYNLLKKYEIIMNINVKEIVEFILKKYRCNINELSEATNINSSILYNAKNNKKTRFAKSTLVKLSKFLKIEVNRDESIIHIRNKLEDFIENEKSKG